MSVWLTSLLLILLVVLTACSAKVSATASEYDPPDNYVDLLFSDDQSRWPKWKHAMIRLGTLDKFKTECETGVISWVPRSYLSGDYVPGARIGLVAGNVRVIDPFPMADFNYPDPQSKFIGMYLHEQFRMEFGVYCIFVSPTIDVLLFCDTGREYQKCDHEGAITLEPGFHWLLIHDTLGLRSGWYTIKTRCHDRTNTCAAGGVTGLYLEPDTRITTYTPSELRGLLMNPTKR